MIRSIALPDENIKSSKCPVRKLGNSSGAGNRCVIVMARR
jgi:hypothetical protein